MSSHALKSSQFFSPLLSAFPRAKRWVIAYSGGVDSHVLLQRCRQFLQHADNMPELAAIHINHQLQQQADDWAAHCVTQAEALGVPLTVVKVKVEQLPQTSLEDQARKARYQVFETFLQPGDVLLQGHHANDQAETLILRLLRGSGSLGLGAMPQRRALGAGHLYRPLLDIPKVAIEAYAQELGLSWVEDPSNLQTLFDRNYVRAEVLPVIQKRWPQYLDNFSRAARLSAESAQLNAELAELDFQAIVTEQGGLRVEPLLLLSRARCNNLLRYWLQRQCLPMPSEQQLLGVVETVLLAQDDAQPQLGWPGAEVYRFAGQLIARPPLPEFDGGVSLIWDTQLPVALSGAGELLPKRVAGRGLKLNKFKQLRICYRQGGEICRPHGRGGSRKLKKLLQELAVPYWLRDRVPLLYVGEELVAVADLVIAEGWAAEKAEKGLEIQLIRP